MQYRDKTTEFTLSNEDRAHEEYAGKGLECLKIGLGRIVYR